MGTAGKKVGEGAEDVERGVRGGHTEEVTSEPRPEGGADIRP